MKLVGLREAKQGLNALVAHAQKERVLLTRHGRPVALLIGVEGQDLECIMLAHDPAFWRMIAERRKPGGKLVSHETVLSRLRAESGTDPARTGPRRTHRRR